MKVKNVVKVMNFHSLLRVNDARRKVEEAHNYERELQKIISIIINNRIFKQENISLKFPTNGKELNIYIGSDLGFCTSFNADVTNYLKEDKKENDKIIIGKKINSNYNNVLLYIEKEDFLKENDKIFQIVLNGVLNKTYSKINIIYVHYYNLNKQEITKRTILPFEFGSDESIDARIEDDYVIEGDLSYIIWSLISIYVSTEIKIAEAWSWASENVKRQEFTNESLKKIEEREEILLRKERKEKKYKAFKTLVENTNRKVTKKKREDIS